MLCPLVNASCSDTVFSNFSNSINCLINSTTNDINLNFYDFFLFIKTNIIELLIIELPTNYFETTKFLQIFYMFFYVLFFIILGYFILLNYKFSYMYSILMCVLFYISFFISIEIINNLVFLFIMREKNQFFIYFMLNSYFDFIFLPLILIFSLIFLFFVIFRLIIVYFYLLVVPFLFSVSIIDKQMFRKLISFYFFNLFFPLIWILVFHLSFILNDYLISINILNMLCSPIIFYSALRLNIILYQKYIILFPIFQDINKKILFLRWFF